MGMAISLVIIMLIIAVWAVWVIWQRRRGKVAAAPVQPRHTPQQTQAQQAFLHGNTCLFHGEVDQAIAAFKQALELDAHHPHAANRLAEAERCQTEKTHAPNTTAAHNSI